MKKRNRIEKKRWKIRSSFIVEFDRWSKGHGCSSHE
jgi:hypothetical protein